MSSVWISNWKVGVWEMSASFLKLSRFEIWVRVRVREVGANERNECKLENWVHFLMAIKKVRVQEVSATLRIECIF